MTTRARLVFAAFVGLVTYGYIKLSQQMDADRRMVWWMRRNTMDYVDERVRPHAD